jgi:hypothetical protein
MTAAPYGARTPGADPCLATDATPDGESLTSAPPERKPRICAWLPSFLPHEEHSHLIKDRAIAAVGLMR